MIRLRKSAFLWLLTALAIVFALVNISVRKVLLSGLQRDNRFYADVDLQDQLEPPAKTDDPKIILFWTRFFGGQNSYMREEGDRLRLQQCPVSNCILSEDRKLWNQSSAIFFHSLDLNLDKLPPKRFAHQYYIFFLLESPEHAFTPDLPHFYNLTFTYRFDSDCIADNYLQYFRPKYLKTEAQFTEIWNKKKFDKAAIFVTNCGGSSQRLEYVQELSKHYPVDVYGVCGNYTCHRSSDNRCDRLVSLYKFYLSFENSLCKDYITEKAIRGYMADTIPVFLGGANYSAVFPQKSFLNVLDYDSPEDLAKEMHKLSNDKEAYFQYFKFRYNRRLNRLPDYLQPENVSLCKLCEILNSKEPNVTRTRAYPSMSSWWNAKTDCRGPPWAYQYPPYVYPENSVMGQQFAKPRIEALKNMNLTI